MFTERVKPHLYHVMVREHSRASGLQALSANIVFVRGLSLKDLGFSNSDQIEMCDIVLKIDFSLLDLVRWLVYILARTSTVGCEVEAWYMWELLPQQMLTKGDDLARQCCSPSPSSSDAFVKVAIPDEAAGCIR
uniref:Uncharacterized protein n=1 Tax=Heterorhabditis bacteriophora TaxID=37862 RepID=A0A1I7XGS1_HETBA